MLIFIDESGDQGFGPKASAYLVFGMVIFRDRAAAKNINKIMDNFRASHLGGSEVKFSGLVGPLRDVFFDAITPRQFEVRAVAIEKTRFLSENSRIHKPAQLIYLTGLVALLDIDLENAIILLDEKSDIHLRRFISYQRNVLNQISANSISQYTMRDSAQHNLLQLADMVVGAVARSYYPHKKHHDRWRNKLGLNLEDVVDM